MPSGLTLKLQEFDRIMRWRKSFPRETVARDRSLRGKARVKARKAKNKETVDG